MFSGITPVDELSKIETITNENSYNQDPSKPIVFGGVVFHDMGAGDLKNLNYTLRLDTEYVQRLSNFLYMPYNFAGPQRWGEDYNIFCSLQTFIDLAYIQTITGETLLITSDNPLQAFSDFSSLDWV